MIFDARLSIVSMPAAGKMYIQDKVEEYADEVFDLLDKGVSLLLSSNYMFVTDLAQGGLIEGNG